MTAKESEPKFDDLGSKFTLDVDLNAINSIEGNLNKYSIDKKPDRENWKGKFDFFLSALAYAVGLVNCIGSVWRFPYLCYKNGGGVFLIPYFVFMILIGIPLVFLEMCVGQFTSSGPLTCWRMTPIFRGIGLSMNIVNGFLLIYYNMLLGYSIYFLYYSFASLNTDLPWEKCNSKWSLPNCFDEKNTFNITLLDCMNPNLHLKCNDGICYSIFTVKNLTATCASNFTDRISLGVWKPSYPSQHFWENVILEKSKSIDETGYLVWQLAVALFLSWLIVYLMVLNGIKVSGKLVYFTSLFPYVVLIILGIRGWLLPGADIGIKFYLKPDFSRLKDFNIWIDAATQLFFTLNVAYGGLVALSSYNKFSTNIMRDAIFVTISNCFTSIFAGFVIFSYLGYLCLQTGQSMNEVVKAGQGLAFVVYPFAVTTIKGSHFWAILFFIMMLVLGLDTMMASMETMITSIFDIVPVLKKTKKRRIISISIFSIILFLMGLILCAQSGTYWVEIFDTYSGNWAILLVAAFECISITWFYGYENFKLDIRAMLGEKITGHFLFNIWKILWTVVSPVVLIAVCVCGWIGSKELEPDGYEFPTWSYVTGNLMTMLTLSGVLLWAFFSLINTLFISKRPFKTLLIPDSKWKPLTQENQMLVNLLHENRRSFLEMKKGEKNEGFDIAENEKF